MYMCTHIYTLYICIQIIYKQILYVPAAAVVQMHRRSRSAGRLGCGICMYIYEPISKYICIYKCIYLYMYIYIYMYYIYLYIYLRNTYICTTYVYMWTNMYVFYCFFYAFGSRGEEGLGARPFVACGASYSEGSEPKRSEPKLADATRRVLEATD